MLHLSEPGLSSLLRLRRLGVNNNGRYLLPAPSGLASHKANSGSLSSEGEPGVRTICTCETHTFRRYRYRIVREAAILHIAHPAALCQVQRERPVLLIRGEISLNRLMMVLIFPPWWRKNGDLIREGRAVLLGVIPFCPLFRWQINLEN